MVLRTQAKANLIAMVSPLPTRSLQDAPEGVVIMENKDPMKKFKYTGAATCVTAWLLTFVLSSIYAPSNIPLLLGLTFIIFLTFYLLVFAWNSDRAPPNTDEEPPKPADPPPSPSPDTTTIAQLRLLAVVRVLITTAKNLEASRKGDLISTRKASKEARKTMVGLVMSLAPDLPEGQLREILEECGSPASIRDVVAEKITDLPCDTQVWALDLLRFAMTGAGNIHPSESQ